MTNKTLLIITDGIGHNSSENFNAFASANTPTYDYLFKNTRLDTASSTRHRFGSIYQERNGKYYFKLNLQIRNK